MKKNTSFKAMFFRIFSMSFAALLVIGLAYAYAHESLGILLLWIPASIAAGALAALAGTWFGQALGEASGGLYGGRKANWTAREKMAGTMDLARIAKMNKDWEKALALVNEILNEAPDYPDALFLKAQVCWTGYQARREALSCLDQVMKFASQDEPVRRWAGVLREEILGRKPKEEKNIWHFDR